MNNVILAGTVITQTTFSHECKGRKFYKFYLETERESGTRDKIPVVFSEGVLDPVDLLGKTVNVKGQFRSCNKHFQDSTRLLLFVFAFDIHILPDQKTTNIVELDGYVVKKPIHRTTPFGREIADILLAVNRNNSKTDYIPVVLWGKNARLGQTLFVGEHIYLTGRFQSRIYAKNEQELTAYELSADRLCVS